MKKIHIGPVGQPWGGISVYLYRLSKLRENDFFLNSSELIGTKRFKIWITKQIFSKEGKHFVIHLHSNLIKIIFYILSLVSFHKFSFVAHSWSFFEDYEKSGFFRQFLFRKSLEKAESIQLINPTFRKFFKYNKIKINKIIVENAFLPPPLEDEKRILNSYKKNLKKFIQTRNPLLIANASHIRFYKKVDLYGLDMCIKLVKELMKIYPNIGFLYALASTKKHKSYFRKMKTKINRLNIGNNFYFMTDQKELWPLLRKADLMVRPTIKDGDSISIREALFFDISVVASDAVMRPEECYIFKSRNQKDFYKKCLKVLQK